jgi:phage tail tube protein FII
MTPVQVAERQLSRHQAKFDAATAALVAAVTEASLQTAAAVVALETGTNGLHAVRAEVKMHGIMRQVLDASGRVAGNVLRSSLQDAFAVDAFEAAVYSISVLLLMAWQARGGFR